MTPRPDEVAQIAAKLNFSVARISLFWSLVDIGDPDQCWPWKGSHSAKGYGSFRLYANRPTNASRVALIIKTGINPQSLFALHSCDNRSCCNPNHLRWGSHRDNIDDMVLRNRANRWNGAREGSRNPGAKLTDRQVIAIRLADCSIATLVAAYGVSRNTIRSVLRGDTYKKVLPHA